MTDIHSPSTLMPVGGPALLLEKQSISDNPHKHTNSHHSTLTGAAANAL